MEPFAKLLQITDFCTVPGRDRYFWHSRGNNDLVRCEYAVLRVGSMTSV